MGFFPCERCGKPYRGKQQTAYPALLDGATDPRMRRRLCPGCFVDLERWLESGGVLVRVGDETSDDDQLALVPCWHKDCANAADRSIFVTLYPLGKPRHDYYARSCVDHDALARAELFGSQTALPENGVVHAARTAQEAPRKR